MGVASKDPQAVVVTALRQARMNAGDIQMIESQDSASPSAKKQQLQDLVTGPTVSYGSMAPLKGLGSTGLGGLCGIGEYSQRKRRETSLTGSHSMAAARLDSRAEISSLQLFAVYLSTEWISCCRNPRPVRCEAGSNVRRNRASSRWPREARAQPCRRDEGCRMEDGRRQVEERG